MSITRMTAILPAALLAFLLAAAAWPAPGIAHVPAPPGARACTAGRISWNDSLGPPATMSSYWTSNGCSQFQSPEIEVAGGGIHYGDSWRTGVGSQYTSTASGPNALVKAWLRYKNTSGGQIWCWREYPTQGTAWFKATGTVC